MLSIYKESKLWKNLLGYDGVKFINTQAHLRGQGYTNPAQPDYVAMNVLTQAQSPTVQWLLTQAQPLVIVTTYGVC